VNRIRTCSFVAVVALIAIACAPERPVPSPSASALAQATPSPTSTVSALDEFRCESETTVTGTADYSPEVGGGVADLEAATRALDGVLSTDEIQVAGDRSGVRRDDRTIFVGRWFQSTTGGWLLSTFNACGDSGINGE